jgi:hypothetical protein
MRTRASLPFAATAQSAVLGVGNGLRASHLSVFGCVSLDHVHPGRVFAMIGITADYIDPSVRTERRAGFCAWCRYGCKCGPCIRGGIISAVAGGEMLRVPDQAANDIDTSPGPATVPANAAPSSISLRCVHRPLVGPDSLQRHLDHPTCLSVPRSRAVPGRV